MRTHPEQKAGEMFIGNVDSKVGIPSFLMGLKTVRLGTTAYFGDGHIMTGENQAQNRPMFVAVAEEKEYYLAMSAL